MPVPPEDLRREYDDYDRVVDIVSAAEVWFTKSQTMSPTVRHFERFPRLRHPEDQEPATPDFTVLFNDGTGLVGEISSLGLQPESLDSLANQLGRYERFKQLPSGSATGGGHMLANVQEIDIVVFVPHRVANACIDRLAGAIAAEEHDYSPKQPPMILAWSYDPNETSYTFARDERGGKNLLIRSHGRSPSLAEWLESNSDTLRGVPRQFVPVKVGRRFMNDEPPELYTATVLWSETIPSLLDVDDSGEPKSELDISASELAEAMRERYGFGTADYVDKVLRFIRRAGLAVQSGDRWRIKHRELTRSDPELREALIARATTKTRARAVATRQDTEEGTPTVPETLLSQTDED